MIFSVSGSIQKIIDGDKTQTRRPTDRYEVGKTYAIQPGRGKFGIPEGRIEITHSWKEINGEWFPITKHTISLFDADDEGGYTPEAYETLYEKMYPGWKIRWAYRFNFVPTAEDD